MPKINLKIVLGVGLGAFIVFILLIIPYILAGVCAKSSESQAPKCYKSQSTALHYSFVLVIVGLLIGLIFGIYKKLNIKYIWVIILVILFVFIIWSIIMLAANNTQCTPDHPSNPVCKNSPPDKNLNIGVSIALGISVAVLVGIIIMFAQSTEIRQSLAKVAPSAEET